MVINNWIGSVGVVEIKKYSCQQPEYNFDWQATAQQFRRICHVCREAHHFAPQCPKRLAGDIIPKAKSESDKRKNSVRFKAKISQIAVHSPQTGNRNRKTPIPLNSKRLKRYELR